MEETNGIRFFLDFFGWCQIIIAAVLLFMFANPLLEGSDTLNFIILIASTLSLLAGMIMFALKNILVLLSFNFKHPNSEQKSNESKENPDQETKEKGLYYKH